MHETAQLANFAAGAVKRGALDSCLRDTALHPPGHAVWQAHLDESR